MDETRQILKKLASLDLSQYPHQQVIDLLGAIGPVGSIVMTLRPDEIILRARPNFNGERFSRVSEISYKPAEFNKTYQRASTPLNTMFYGGTISENINPKELNIPRVIGLFEGIQIMRNPNFIGEQVVTFSRWRVVKEIPLVSIIHHRDFKRNNSYAEEQRENFEKFLAGQTKEVGEKTRMVVDFIASEYAKDITPNDYDYLISAVYAEMATENGLAGVFYPSVRTGGEGFNVAIHPSFVDQGYIVPEAVGECTIYKRQKRTIIDNETVALILQGQTEFEFKPVEPKYHCGRELIIRELYPENF